MTTKNEGLSFTCRTCGGHELQAIHRYILSEPVVSILSCECGHAPDGIAAENKYTIMSRCETTGMVDHNHQVNWNEEERLEELGNENEIVEVYCRRCCDRFAADSYQWESGQGDESTHEKSDAIVVECAQCHRNIEFEWSHSGQAGRIWPTES